MYKLIHYKQVRDALQLLLAVGAWTIAAVIAVPHLPLDTVGLPGGLAIYGLLIQLGVADVLLIQIFQSSTKSTVLRYLDLARYGFVFLIILLCTILLWSEAFFQACYFVWVLFPLSTSEYLEHQLPSRPACISLRKKSKEKLNG